MRTMVKVRRIFNSQTQAVDFVGLCRQALVSGVLDQRLDQFHQYSRAKSNSLGQDEGHRLYRKQYTRECERNSDSQRNRCIRIRQRCADDAHADDKRRLSNWSGAGVYRIQSSQSSLEAVTCKWSLDGVRHTARFRSGALLRECGIRE